MNWIQSIARWRSLPAESKLRHRWGAIPTDVAESMAFEGEPVSMDTIRATFDRIEPPVGLMERASEQMTCAQ